MVTMLQQPSKPIAIPGQLDNTISYREIIKQLAAQQTTKPYGDIPPMLSKRHKKKRPKSSRKEQQEPMRRMSHVEDWIVVDSKESLPDEEELVQSPLRNFLSADFFTQVLPLHMPPPSLSERFNLEEEEGERRMLQTVDDDDFTEEEEEEEEEDTSSTKDLLRRHSVSSFNTKSSPTSSTTTVSYSIPTSSSPPQGDHALWKETLAKLKRTLIVSPPSSVTTTPAVVATTTKPVAQKTKKRLNKFIPMPIPPRRPISQKRRSEATTQPRFNPDTNTYTRDTRSNPDHLRMISAELNMMRGRKLLSPLKPRGFLPRRKDAFIRGIHRKPSPLIFS
ncbi:uncharacterized protein EV154DRAFT_528103 [Mucor mucedo]|uniref:uncharacterized protein n=1 Tax=Mucor mucedo TaxID=29922 RepID=UPI002220C6A2|nr:uncharacterized protein EV154DRAFT_528103 [Mucor mucedo]KAI7873472.1 hypothetical protein EV154DRAFT_528103 [Mucor mucedo]